MRKHLYFIATVVLAISCSSPAEKAAVADEQAYSPAHIQSLAQTDYEAAMKLTEEALRKGGMSLFTASTLRANITYQFTEDYDVAAAYMRKALDLDEAKDPGTRSELLYHLVTILRNSRDFTALLSACTEGKECAHRAGKVFEEYSFDFLAGNCLYDLGEDETGFEMMHSALSAAGKTAATEAEFGHLLYFTSQYINSLRGDKNYQGALTACTAYEGFIDWMERSFPDVDPAYIDRCRFYLDIYRSVCNSYLGEGAAASKAFGSALTRDYAVTTGGQSFLVDYYAASGQPDKILGNTHLVVKRAINRKGHSMQDYDYEGQYIVFNSKLSDYWIASRHSPDLYGPMNIKELKRVGTSLGIEFPITLESNLDSYACPQNIKGTDVCEQYDIPNEPKTLFDWYHYFFTRRPDRVIR